MTSGDGSSGRPGRSEPSPSRATSSCPTPTPTTPGPVRRARRSSWTSRTRTTAGGAMRPATPRASSGASGPTIPGHDGFEILQKVLLRRYVTVFPPSQCSWRQGVSTVVGCTAVGSRRMGPIESDDRLLLDRTRLGLRLILAGVAIVFVGALLLHRGSPLINVVQAINFVVVAAALALLADRSRRSFTLAVGLAAYTVTIVSTGAAGILAHDATTSVVILVGLSIVSATLVPWSPWWQLLSAVVIAGTVVWTVMAVVPSPPLFWLQNIGAIAPTLASTVVISHVLGRERATIVHAAQAQRSREESLRDANQRLESEIQEHRRTEDALRFAMRELDHRVKNTLATVQSVADQTVRSSTSMDEFAAAFAGRIKAMARIHSALAGRRRKGLAVGELIELVVGPYRRRTDSVSIEADGTFLTSE